MLQWLIIIDEYFFFHFRFKVEYQAKFIERSQNIEVREAALRGK